jgi:hypothetical protein
MTLINLEQKKMIQSSIVPTIQTLTKTPTGHQYCNMSDVCEVESFLHNDGLRVNSKNYVYATDNTLYDDHST